MAKLRALIVDDEPFARERVRRLLESDEEIEVIGECADGFKAVSFINEYAPDLVFLDVQMPGRDGFGVLAELDPARTPVTVFLTAYDQYAVRAFDACALDYVLKPFDEERFERAVNRAKNQLRLEEEADDKDAAASFLQLDQFRQAGTKYLERIIVKSAGRILFLKTSEIDWIEAYGNYVRLHFEKSSYLLRETISNLETQLDPEKFLRIHRSALVNIERIQEMQPTFHGQYTVILRDGTRLTLSRRHKSKVQKSIGKAF